MSTTELQRHTLSRARRLLRPLQILRDARICAMSNAIDTWQLSVEVNELDAAGLSPSAVRWLIANSFVEHGREVTNVDDFERVFDCSGRFTLSEDSCLVLTDAGAAFLQSVQQAGQGICSEPGTEIHHSAVGEHERSRRPDKSTTHVEQSRRAVPSWNSAKRELKVGSQLVKQFRVPASNQEAILSAFEEEGWPEQIDDPLSPCHDIPAKSRLHSAIASLNRNQKNSLVHFSGNGTGDGIFWKLSEDSER